MKTQSEKEKKLDLALSKLKNLNIENPSIKKSLENLGSQKNQLEIEKKEIEKKYQNLISDHKALNQKFTNLKNDLGNIGENKLLLITSVQILDEYFETNKKVEQKKTELNNLSNKFRELKSLVYDFRDKKKEEMQQLSKDHEDFKKEIEKNKENYEKIIEDATGEIESFVEKVNLENQVQ